MRKAIMMVLVIAVVGITTASAETWEQFIKRAETMTYNSVEGRKRGDPSTWNYDKWGALLATYEWLKYAYEDIYKKAPNLTSYERSAYGDIYKLRARQYKELDSIFDLIHGGNTTSIDKVRDRCNYWYKHLENGGTIKFN